MLVLFGHLLPNHSIVKAIIYSFHMPLFFITAGYVLSNRPFSSIVKKRFRSVIIPYLVFGLIYGSFDLKSLCFILYGSNESLIYAGSNGMLWFLPCLFFSIVMGGEVVRRNMMISIPFFLFVGFLLHKLHNSIALNSHILGFPFAIDIVTISTAFVLFGYLIRTTKYFSLPTLPKSKLIIVSLLFFTSILSIFNRPQLGYTQMATGTLGNWFAFYVIAVISSVGILSLSQLLSYMKPVVRPLSWLGQNSLAIFIVHRSLLYSLKPYCENPHNIILLAMAFCILLGYCIVLAFFMNKYIPAILGK